MSDDEKRIIVEIISHAEVERLRQEMRDLDDKRCLEIKSLRKELEGLHRTFYEFLEAFGPGRKR